MLRFLYETVPGRAILRVLTAPWLSRAIGAFLDTRASRIFIPLFLKKGNIDLSEYLPERYASFNACFTRRIRPERRPVDAADAHLIAPCDGRLSAYRIDGSTIPIKHSRYSVAQLLGNDPRSAEFQDGVCLVFRLCVDDYHRYRYFDSGRKGENHFVAGALHTVRPIALENTDVFVQNAREYTFMQTDHFGLCAQIEVGAMLVGRIKNLHGAHTFARGEEKGYFEYGGSTIVLLLKKNAANIPESIFADTQNNIEQRVLCGSMIASSGGG